VRRLVGRVHAAMPHRPAAATRAGVESTTGADAVVRQATRVRPIGYGRQVVFLVAVYIPWVLFFGSRALVLWRSPGLGLPQRLNLAAGAILLAAPVAVGFPLVAARSRQADRLLRDGTRTEGTVTSVRSRSSRDGRTSWMVTYRYRLDGDQWQDAFNAGSETPTGWSVGDAIPIACDPSKHGRHLALGPAGLPL